jgi:redox-sensitive bicupin YhaK (pirin superfamily)
MRRAAVALVASLGVAVAVAVVAFGQEAVEWGRDALKVVVLNFPTTWRVEGEVGVKSPISPATMIALRDVQVSPVARKDTTRLVAAGTVTAQGFSSAVLSLTGQIKGEVAKPGTIGALLVPDEEPVIRALDEQGQLLLTMEVVSESVSGRMPYFASDQPRFQVAFERYRVYLYNTTDKTAEVSLFAYLTN